MTDEQKQKITELRLKGMGYKAIAHIVGDVTREGVRYYEPTSNGSEAAFRKYLEELKKIDERNNKG